MEVIGINDLIVYINELKDIRSYEPAMHKTVALLEREAKLRCPVDDGTLRRSITSDVSFSGKTLKGEVYSPMEYAPYVEYGTGLFAENGDGRTDVPWRYQDEEGNWYSTYGQSPQPFMRPAVDENIDNITSIFEQEVAEIGKR